MLIARNVYLDNRNRFCKVNVFTRQIIFKITHQIQDVQWGKKKNKDIEKKKISIFANVTFSKCPKLENYWAGGGGGPSKLQRLGKKSRN